MEVDGIVYAQPTDPFDTPPVRVPDCAKACPEGCCGCMAPAGLDAKCGECCKPCVPTGAACGCVMCPCFAEECQAHA